MLAEVQSKRPERVQLLKFTSDSLPEFANSNSNKVAIFSTNTLRELLHGPLMR